MTVADLLDKLTRLDPDAEIRLALQPNYPFQYNIDAVVQVPVLNDRDAADIGAPEGAKNVVYISERGQVHHQPYLPAAAAHKLNW
jgi:hypothetical protein